jgi:hypothetical protein
MTKIIPWSPSSLDTFCNCPHQFHQTKVLKLFKSEQGEEQIWGDYVHKKFAERQANRLALPDDLQDHETFMAKLEALPGWFFTELKVALDTKLTPCNFFNKECFFRGIIDYMKLDEPSESANLVDYKSGKPFDKWKQMAAYAIHTFICYPYVKTITAQFYWTQTKTTTKKVWTHDDINTVLWPMLLPDLKQYKEAFAKDIWQKRPSGLCKGWCPVVSCEHYETIRRRA